MTKSTVYSLAQVAQHNTIDSLWTVVHGRVLDVTNFASNHPGGRNLLLLAGGIDATILFETYHLRGVQASVVQKYQIGVLESASPSYYVWDVKDASDEFALEMDPNSFYPTVKRRVYERLQSLGKARRGGTELHIKAALILLTLCVTWYVGWFHRPSSNALAFLIAIVHGFAAAQVGLSIMHDANHGSFSTNSSLGRIAGHTLDFIGASSVVWSYQHVVSHHAYTNLETRTVDNLEFHRAQKDSNRFSSNELSDSDARVREIELALNHENDTDVFSSFPMIRMHPGDPKSWYHKYQHLYSPFLFGFFTMIKILYSDVVFALAGRVSHVSMASRMSQSSEQALFWGLKALNLTAMIGIPAWRHGWAYACAVTAVAHVVAGELLAVMFIVNHVSDFAEFYSGGEELNVKGADAKPRSNRIGEAKRAGKRDWAALQSRGTVNWAVGSWFWNHFSGGLNHQLEHHLFPGVTHTNYVYIADVVRTTCEEFGVDYLEVPTLRVAAEHCLGHLEELGK